MILLQDVKEVLQELGATISVNLVESVYDHKVMGWSLWSRTARILRSLPRFDKKVLDLGSDAVVYRVKTLNTTQRVGEWLTGERQVIGNCTNDRFRLFCLPELSRAEEVTPKDCPVLSLAAVIKVPSYG